MTVQQTQDFQQTIRRLRKMGYQVKIFSATYFQSPKDVVDGKIIKKGAEYIFQSETRVNFHGRNIFGMIYKTGDEIRLYADNSGCFDMASKCSLIVKIPTNYKELKKHLRWLGTKEGFENSNSYDYIKNPFLPREIPTNN